MCRRLRGIVCCLLVCVTQASAQQASAPVSILVTEIRPALVLGNEPNTWQMRLAVTVSVQNRTTSPLVVTRQQFLLTAGGKSVSPAPSDTNELFADVTLKPEQRTNGILWYSGVSLTGEEIPLKLTWTPSDLDPNESEAEKAKDVETGAVAQPVVLDLNAELRKLYAHKRKSVGPGGELQIITVDRPLNILASWALRDVMVELSRSEVQRVLFAPDPEGDLTVNDEFLEWLASMLESPPGAQMLATRVPMPRSSARFKHLSLAEFKEIAGRANRSSRRTIVQYRTVEDGVCAALTPLYRFVPVDQAIRDLRNTDPGVRRAAMAGAVDRLTSEQAQAILEQARTGDERTQIEIASYLNLIPGKDAVETLTELCLSQNRKVASEALRSLVKSREDSVENAVGEVWKAGETTPVLQSEMVQAIVEVSDERWAPLVADYLSTYLKQATQPDAATIPGESISGALGFLEREGDAITMSMVRDHVSRIRNPAIQDLFLQHFLQHPNPENEAVIRACVTARLAENQVSSLVAVAAARYRDPAWTDALMAAFTLSRSDSRNAPQFLNAALECASNAQLETVAAQFSGLEVHQQMMMLQHLARVNYPDWRKVASEVLALPGARSAEVIPLLAQDGSEESLKLLRDRLEAYVVALEGTPDSSVEGQHFFQTLISNLAMFVHPECRRLMNRLSRNPNQYIRERVAVRLADAERRAPGYHLLVSEAKLRKAGNIADADKVLDDCLMLNPLFPRAYIQRSSVAMHAGRFDDSMKDLREADWLSPEDVDVQSMIALVMVRQDRIEDGLKYANEVIAMAPQDWTSLYNGACTFARATESSLPTAEAKTSYADRAIELLKLTAALKFADSEHMLTDADLKSLHQHAEWQSVVSLVNANKAPAPEPPKEDQ